MDNVQSEFLKADNILYEYTTKNDKFVSRFDAILKDINTFIKTSGFDGKVVVNELALGYALLDYFEDVHRLKTFHHLEHINSIKIVSHTAYWLLRRMPIQMVDQSKELLYINERFVLAYVLHFLSGADNESILKRTNSGLTSFTETLFYFLKYRFYSADTLELMITAFFAGQIFQEKDQDLSADLGLFCDKNKL